MARATESKKPKGRTVHIKRGDTVMVIAGKEFLGRQTPRRGRVLKVDRLSGRVTVEGINMIKKAVRESSKVRQAGVVDLPAPIDASNVMVVCPACDAPTRVSNRVNKEGDRVRVCKRCGQDID